MAEKENKQKHKSTIDKYFSRTADGIAQAMQRDKFLRTIVITAARKFFFDK